MSRCLVCHNWDKIRTIEGSEWSHNSLTQSLATVEPWFDNTYGSATSHAIHSLQHMYLSNNRHHWAYFVHFNGTSKIHPETSRTLVKSWATNHGIVVVFLSVAAAVLVRTWQLVARLKAHDLRRWFRWSAADQSDNNVAKIAIPMVLLNPRRDTIAPAGVNRKSPYWLI